MFNINGVLPTIKEPYFEKDFRFLIHIYFAHFCEIQEKTRTYTFSPMMYDYIFLTM